MKEVNTRYLLIVIAVLIAIFSIQRFLLFGAKGYLVRSPQDFNSYFVAAKGFLQGRDPYVTPQLGGMGVAEDAVFYPFIYPPLSLLVVLGLTPFDAHTAGLIFLLANTLLLFFSLHRFGDLFFPQKEARLLIASVGFAFQPIIASFLMGQMNVIVLCLVALSYYYYVRGRRRISALLVALGIFVKVTPIFLIAYYLLRKEFDVALKAVVWLTVLLVMSIAIFGLDLHWEYIEAIRHYGSGPISAFENQGLNGFLARLLTQSYVAEPLLPWSTHFQSIYSVLTVILVATSFAFCAISRSRSAAFGIILSASLLVTPIAWYHTFTTLYLVLIIVLHRVIRERRGAENWVLLFCLVFFFHGSTANLGSFLDPANYRSGMRTLALSIPFYMLLATWAGLLAGSLRQTRISAEPSTVLEC